MNEPPDPKPRGGSHRASVILHADVAGNIQECESILRDARRQGIRWPLRLPYGLTGRRGRVERSKPS